MRRHWPEREPRWTETDARHLRELPDSWSDPMEECAARALARRGHVMVLALFHLGHKREAARLRSRLSLLERTDERHERASYAETLEGLYRALPVLAGEPELVGDGEHFLDWSRAAASDPAVAECTAARARARRWVAETIAAYAPLLR